MALRLCQQVVQHVVTMFVLLLCCAVFMKIMKWHYHRLYIYNYIYIHIFQRATVYSGGGTSRYSSKQLFLKSFAESRFLRNALETIAEQSFPFYEVLNQVDWNTLQKAFDALVAPSLWAHTLSTWPPLVQEFWKHEVHLKIFEEP